MCAVVIGRETLPYKHQHPIKKVSARRQKEKRKEGRKERGEIKI